MLLVRDDPDRAREAPVGIELGQDARPLLQGRVVRDALGALLHGPADHSSNQRSRSAPRSRAGIATTIRLPDQCAAPVFVRRVFARISSSGRSKAAGTVVTVVEGDADRALIAPRPGLT